MKVLKAGTFGFYDVFTGTGWKNHTRVRWNNKVGHLQFVTGRHLSKNVVKAVLDFINSKDKKVEEVKKEEPRPLPAAHNYRMDDQSRPMLYLVK